VRLPNAGPNPALGAKGLWVLGGPTVSTVVGHRTGHKPSPWGGSRLWSNRRKRGRRWTALKPLLLRGSPRKQGQGFKPDLGNPAVRHYRGPRETSAMVGPRTRPAIERAGTVTPPPTARRARVLSQRFTSGICERLGMKLRGASRQQAPERERTTGPTLLAIIFSGDQPAMPSQERCRRGNLRVTLEEGTWAAGLDDRLKPHVTPVTVGHPRPNAWLKSGNQGDRREAQKLAERRRQGALSAVYPRENGLRTRKELLRSYRTLSQDLTRVRNRLKARYPSWGMAGAGTRVYAPRQRGEWWSQIPEAGVRCGGGDASRSGDVRVEGEEPPRR
jgi:hypothetical protein